MNNRFFYIFTIAAFTLLASCSTCREGGTADADTASNAQEIPFRVKLLQEIHSSEEKENICLSPLSAQFAIAMTATGAKGETLEQMNKCVELDSYSGEKAKEFITYMQEKSTGYETVLANSIWINDKLQVKESFTHSNKEYFHAQVNSIPFDKYATEKINSWCRENTNEKIGGIINKVKENDMIYLINAIYFKAPWRNPFKSTYTTKEEFTTSNGKKTEVDMMKQTLRTSYYSNGIAQIVSKPFKERFEMLFILPHKERSIDDAMCLLGKNYKSLTDSMKQHTVELSLPKFKCEYGASLKKALCNIGMDRAFSGRAEFGGISDAPLYIDNVIQKTYINVDEEGAEAAAVTAVTVGLMSSRPVKRVTMTIDRPFLYAIRDITTDTILFIGIVGNPNEK